jgi:hypothetical protein
MQALSHASRCLLLFSLFGCAGKATGAELENERIDTDDGAVDVSRATWSHISTNVDVSITLATERGTGRCLTDASLVIDKANAAPQTYRMSDTDCSVLALTEVGDILLYESPTSHDWASVQLRVYTDEELIELGPWMPTQPHAPSYRFTLAAPACGDDCSCPFLRRRAGSQDLLLQLPRHCE